MGALNHRFFFFLGGGFLIAIDRILKNSALIELASSPPKNPVPILGWFPHLNGGIAFGIPLPLLFTIYLTVALIFFFFALVVFKNHRSSALIFIMYGATSNLYDRLFFQGTIDYFSFFYAILNISDIMIVLGVAWYIGDSFFKKTGRAYVR